MVFIDGRRRGRSLFYYRTRNGREVDFAWKDDSGQVCLVQVCEQMPEGSETRARERAALREAQSEQPDCRAVVVTRDEETIADSPHGAIEVIPVWKWLLQ